MAALGVVGVIGLLGSALSIFQFGRDNFPKKESSTSTVSHATIRIQVGLDTKDGLSNAGGDYPDVRIFNEGGEFIGSKYDTGKIKNGGFTDLKVDVKGQQPTYSLFSANNDAVCIAYISQTWPDGQQYGWLGNMAHCHSDSIPWYYSNIILDNKAMDCMWIDGNGDATDVTGFQVHFSEFTQKGDKFSVSQTQDILCNSGPPFKTYTNKDPNSITYWTLSHKRNTIPQYVASPVNINTTTPEKSTTASGNPLARDTRLIKSNKKEHCAVAICQDPSSAGPDFVNPEEGVFCCMKTKKSYPVCPPTTRAGDMSSYGPDNSTTPTNGTTYPPAPESGPCFDLEKNTMRGLVLKRGDPLIMPSVQGYNTIVEW
ncbi:hypothetical protein BJ875DRAFT_514773 [Amylocarpus encephaloides]|uniref:Uncharacterized protein n=1 Tax=Amylocarpus encephaloides TaxID=45428 RepID=A0A9P7YTK9_9HELO|nr:hypothetical protein BJ875DRAFT_514773 [Amylocarpus encephaloides]